MRRFADRVADVDVQGPIARLAECCHDRKSIPAWPPSVQKRRVAFLHTAAPAIPPLAQFYAAQAPDLDITNLMEDGIIRLLAPVARTKPNSACAP